MKRVAKRPNEHDDFDAGETTYILPRVPPRSGKVTLLKEIPSGSKQAPSCVRANQIVCQFPNANCAILVSHEYRNSQSTQAHQASYKSQSTRHISHMIKETSPLDLTSTRNFCSFSLVIVLPRTTVYRRMGIASPLAATGSGTAASASLSLSASASAPSA